MSDKEQQEKERQEIKQILETNREVIKKLVSEGQLPEPRPLTRTERKRLDAAGLNPLKIKRDDPRLLTEIKEEMTDWILDTIYPDFPFDLPNNVCMWFGDYVFGISYRDDLAAKNL